MLLKKALLILFFLSLFSADAADYCYDVHGNVKNLIQEISANGITLKKRMDYDYDLVSGKVNFMYYQKNQPDQFIHKYEYDGDNRIVKVFTSRDAITWDRDAKYDYYAHGPLAQTTIGEHGVETNTYAYTIQGWIKGMNGASFSYALGYFNDGTHKDYQGIGGGSNYTLSTTIASGKSLFNGNIATMASNTPQFASQGGANWVQQFEYDQLNRITASSTLAGATANTYKTGYSYDAGGNIKSLQRYDKDGNQFDNMGYHYENTASSQNYKTNTNKLRWVDDTEPVADYAGDIDNQASDNYQYDEIGNLIADKSEEIEKIEWTVYGKVKKVTRMVNSTKPDLEFAYDANGNKVLKTVKEKSGAILSTYYLRNANANVMGVYESNNGSAPILEELYLYTDKRFGTVKPTNFSSDHILDQKEYELSDHLGNVRVVISDKLVSQIAEVVAAIDYLVFGMEARVYFNGTKVRHGFNSKEKIEEWGAQDYGMRIYSPKLGRFFSVDPISSMYPELSTYQFAGNKPIWAIDLDGLEPLVASDYKTMNQLKKKLKLEYCFEVVGEKQVFQVTVSQTYGKIFLSHTMSEYGPKQTDFSTFTGKAAYAMSHPGNAAVLNKIDNMSFRAKNSQAMAVGDMGTEIMNHLVKGQNRGTLDNTMLHVNGQALFTSIFGRGYAQLAGDIHERDHKALMTGEIPNKGKGLTAAIDNYSDMVNNQWGQRWGEAIAKDLGITKDTKWTDDITAKYLNALQGKYALSMGLKFKSEKDGGTFKATDEFVKKYTTFINANK